MRCNIEYTKPNGKRSLVKVANQPRESPNKEAARQFIRNHKYQFENMVAVPLMEKG